MAGGSDEQAAQEQNALDGDGTRALSGLTYCGVPIEQMYRRDLEKAFIAARREIDRLQSELLDRQLIHIHDLAAR